MYQEITEELLEALLDEREVRVGAENFDKFSVREKRIVWMILVFPDKIVNGEIELKCILDSILMVKGDVLMSYENKLKHLQDNYDYYGYKELNICIGNNDNATNLGSIPFFVRKNVQYMWNNF